MPADRYIEHSFPIVSLNPLSVRERNAFKPIYKMHKWFARRSASTFRAILLASSLPYRGQDGEPIDLMAEFYKGHGEDPRLRDEDGNRLKVLDPFMGGGTTVVEALRLGFDVTGIDLNPIAWFIVKGETTPVDLAELDAAYQRLADKVKDELLALYKTRCPLTGDDADIIYGFWVKQGICVDPGCGAVTDLFKSYEVARKRGDATLTYVPDVVCPHCDERFDWELNRCTITAGGPQVNGLKSAGSGRPEGTRWAFALNDAPAACPHCAQPVPPSALGAKARRKKVPLHVVLDPATGQFFEVRGKLPAEVTVPFSGEPLRPKDDAPCARGKFVCQSCGRQQRVVESADANAGPLPFRYYGFYAHTPFVDDDNNRGARNMGLDTNNHKWFAAVTEADQSKVEQASARLAAEWDELPLPTQEIPHGRNFRDLKRQHYARWTDVYGPRQLLALGTLLRAIAEEPMPVLRDALLGAFQSHLDNVSQLTAYHSNRNMPQRVTAAHDYRNPTTIVENNVWGVADGVGAGPYRNCVIKYRDGLAYRSAPTVGTPDGDVDADYDESPPSWTTELHQGSSASQPLLTGSIPLIVTDPPYAGSVQYAEMSDWTYVWLHHVLKDVYPDQFGPEITLKSQEIIEDQAMKDMDWYFEQLTDAWHECHRVLKDDGLLVFTFHHKEGDRWTGLLRSLFDAGFYLVAAYPTHSEALNSIVIQSTKGITYDIIHVCRKRQGEPESIPWTVLRREVQRDARQQLAQIEASGDVLPGPDVWMILLGKALRHFSLHYGQVLDEHGEPLELDEAMERIRVLVREVRGETVPLPGSLKDIDSLSQVALLHTSGPKTWTRDGLHIELRGYTHSLQELEQQGFVRASHNDKSMMQSVGVLERVQQADAGLGKDQFSPLVDKLHRAVSVLNSGQTLTPWLSRWVGSWEQVRDGLSWLAKQDSSIREVCLMGMRLIEQAGPEPTRGSGTQTNLFGE